MPKWPGTGATLPLWLLLSLQLVVLNSWASRLNLSESCTDTKTFFCSLSNITGTYDDPLQLGNVSKQLELGELVLRNSLIGRIPSDVFVQAPNLRVFIMHNCGVHRLSVSDFAGAKQLRQLVLQRNRFFDLPEKVFAAAFSLERLQLGHNTLHLVHRTAFAGLSKLRYLDLQQNAIRSLPERVFADLVTLEHIDLSGNEIERIDAQTFAENRQLQAVLLSDNKFTVFEPQTLRHLPHLHLVDVSNSVVEELILQSVDTLLAQSCTLRRCVISGSAIKVHAGNNQLTGISIGDKLSLRELELHGNLLESLDDIVGMFNLQRLDVSKNQIKSLSTSRSPLNLPLPSLTNLNLASNQLQNLSADNFLLLQKLTHLDLAFNHLLRLDQRIFEPLLNLEKCYIEANRLHAFDYEQFVHSHEYLKEIGLFDNEWEFRYMRKMINYLKDRGIQLPVRFTSNSVLDHIPGTTATEFTSSISKGAHHRYAATTTNMDGGALELTSPQDPSGVTGIHPYWTVHDVLALITLLFVLLILFLQLLRILQEEQCLSRCWRRGTERLGVAATHNQHQRIDEEDSEV